MKAQPAQVVGRQRFHVISLELIGRRGFALVRKLVLLQAPPCIQKPVEEPFLSLKCLEVQALSGKPFGECLRFLGQGFEIAQRLSSVGRSIRKLAELFRDSLLARGRLLKLVRHRLLPEVHGSDLPGPLVHSPLLLGNLLKLFRDLVSGLPLRSFAWGFGGRSRHHSRLIERGNRLLRSTLRSGRVSPLTL